MKRLIIALSVLFLAGCAGLPTSQEAAAADHGPFPTNYEQIVKRFYGNSLKDPTSAQYRNISYPERGWLGDRFSGAKYGYIVCVKLNAKNSYGAYTGFQTDALLIRNDSVIQYVPKGDWWGHQMC